MPSIYPSAGIVTAISPVLSTRTKCAARSTAAPTDWNRPRPTKRCTFTALIWSTLFCCRFTNSPSKKYMTESLPVGRNSLGFLLLLLLLLKVSNPFYLIQLYTIIVWMAQEFYEYTAVIILTTILVVGTSVWETRKVNLIEHSNRSPHLLGWKLSRVVFRNAS